MKSAILLFCLLDIGFLVCFLFSIIYDFGAHVVLVVIAAIACFTYYPLISLYKELSDNNSSVLTRMWLINHMQFCTFYCFTRAILVLVYFSTIIIDGGGLDISYIFKHVSVDVIIVLSFLSFFFLAQFIINYGWIVPYFREKIKRGERQGNIYMTVYQDHVEVDRVVYPMNRFPELVSNAQKIYLVPSTKPDGNVDVSKLTQ